MIDVIGKLEEKAKLGKVNILVNEGWDERVLEATHQILEQGLCEVTLMGDEKEIRDKVKKLGLDIKDTKIIDLKKEDKLKEEFAKELVEVRKHKGMTLEKAKELMEDYNYFAVMYVYKGHADALGGSCICSTAALMRPALQILRKKDSIVSETSIMKDVKNKRVLFISDCSLNVDPNPEQLAQISTNAAEVVRMFDVEPKVAIVSFSTKGSGEHTILEPLHKAVEVAKEKDKELIIDAEYQFDAAVNPKAAKRKCPDAVIQGDANTIIFPNLTASNIFCHGVLQFSDMEFIFAVLRGLNKPIAIFGRSNHAEGIKNMIVNCAMQCNLE